jgi:hypothetical protein
MSELTTTSKAGRPFLNHARGILFEVETQTGIADRLALISPADSRELLLRTAEPGRLLNVLIKAIGTGRRVSRATAARSPQPAARSPKPAARSLKPASCSLHPEARSPQPEACSLQPEACYFDPRLSIHDCRINTAAMRSTTSPRRRIDISVSRSTRFASADVSRSSHRCTGSCVRRRSSSANSRIFIACVPSAPVIRSG